MRVATFANARTALEARHGVGRAFAAAFRSGTAMGFLLASRALLVLYTAVNLFGLYYGDDWGGLYESITGYGLGGSSVALFGRVGGGIYTKAADVGADLVGKVERNIPQDDPRNPAVRMHVTVTLSACNVLLAVIADNVGDNVGDIAGMGSDLFGSYAESSCAKLFVASICSFGAEHDLTAMMYPLLISAVGLLVCAITTVVATDVTEVKESDEVGPVLKRQILISAVLMTAGVAAVTFLVQLHPLRLRQRQARQELAVARSCRTGAATNVIFGLAVGYKSVIVPILAIAAAIYASFRLAAMYGIALEPLGMLSTIAKGLAIDAYGPISDNAGGIAEMAALFGAYVSRAGITAVDVLSVGTGGDHRVHDPGAGLQPARLVTTSLRFHRSLVHQSYNI
ncbi:pyrophosphate-energized vacuolar membrane proton pump-like [Miscanthus floridulus]|uniref:pyrophosphate-energized vacuolar membrane proton pump-like n=1 Tax=Miscanthus floridulus TaxID=154761 RepID=UPI003459464C